jgi:hypothetical protein
LIPIEKDLKTYQNSFQGFQAFPRSHSQSLMNFRIARLGFWRCLQISDLKSKIKEKEKKREVITQKIYARVFGVHKHELRSKM